MASLRDGGTGCPALRARANTVVDELLSDVNRALSDEEISEGTFYRLTEELRTTLVRGWEAEEALERLGDGRAA